MKLIIPRVLSIAIAGLVLSGKASAQDKETPKEAIAKVVTMSGTATCSKCDLSIDKKCASVLQVKEGEKTVTYYLAGIAGEAWHENLCTAAKEATLTGTVTELDGKKTLTVSKIDKLAKTMSGTATCSKCDLGISSSCGSVLQVKEGKKTVTYYLAGIADKEWHENICTAAKEATLTGTVTELDGKKTLTVSKVDKLAK